VTEVLPKHDQHLCCACVDCECACHRIDRGHSAAAARRHLHLLYPAVRALPGVARPQKEVGELLTRIWRATTRPHGPAAEPRVEAADGQTKPGRARQSHHHGAVRVPLLTVTPLLSVVWCFLHW